MKIPKKKKEKTTEKHDRPSLGDLRGASNSNPFAAAEGFAGGNERKVGGWNEPLGVKVFNGVHSPKLTVRTCQEAFPKGNSSSNPS